MMTEVQKKLVEDNHNLIYGAIHTYNWDIDDTYDLCAIGLCKAAMTWDKDYGTAFTSYAYSCMRQEVLNYYQHNIRKQKGFITINLDSPIPNTESLTIADTVSNGLSLEDEILFLNFDNCTNNEKKAFNLRLQGYQTKEIGLILGVSQSYVSRLVKQAYNKVVSQP